jgi:excisionase family DNA binding protein
MELLSTNEASRLLGLTPDGIRYLANVGVLRAVRLATGQRLFSRRSVERLAEERRRSGPRASAVGQKPLETF